MPVTPPAVPAHPASPRGVRPDGTPLRLGDVVTHEYREGSWRVELIEGTELRIVCLTDSGGPSWARTWGYPRECTWVSNAPEDYAPRILVVGDVVRFYGDTLAREVMVRETRRGPESPQIRLAPVPDAPQNAAIAAHGYFGNSWYNADDFYFVRAVAPNLRPSVPVDPTLGCEAPADFDFADDLTAWFITARTASGTAYALRQVAAFMGEAPYATWQAHVSRHTLAEPRALAERVRAGFVATLNNMRVAAGRGSQHCPTCAAQRQLNIANSEACRATHFVCGVCGSSTQAESCAICTRLQFGDGTRYKCCTTCCSHTTCGCGCGEGMLKAEKCVGCGKGLRCCRCPRCEHSGCKLDQKSCCGNCANHCVCDHQCFRFVNRSLYKHPAPPREKGMTRLLGAEIETAGSKGYSPLLRDAVKKWRASIVGDGSIYSPGVELVTQPAGGSQWLQMIADLGAGFAESKAFTSSACGLHIHVDAGDMGVWEVRRLIKLYAHIEQCLYDALPFSRTESRFSIPCGQKYLKWLDNLGAKLTKTKLQTVQYGLVPPRMGMRVYDDKLKREVIISKSTQPTIDRMLQKQAVARTSRKYDETRYNGLNMHSYWFRGTFEFRHHHGTNDPVKITNWGIFVGSIVDFAATKSDAGVAKLLKLAPREAVFAMGIREETLTWLKSRWELFTSAPGVRLRTQPLPAQETGEV